MAGQYYWEKEVKEHLDNLPKGQKSAFLNDAVRTKIRVDANPSIEREYLVPEVEIVE